MAFHVIRPAPDLTDAEYRVVLGAGPPDVSVRQREYAELLERAEFGVLE